MPSSTITSQKEDEEDATNPFVYPPTLHPEEDADHMPGWLRALFFTTLCGLFADKRISKGYLPFLLKALPLASFF
jgi:hypothetical protein